MKPPVSASTDLTVFQSVFSYRRVMTASMTKMTAFGGFGKVLISTIAALSSDNSAFSAASNSGLAALRSASASSEIIFAS